MTTNKKKKGHNNNKAAAHNPKQAVAAAAVVTPDNNNNNNNNSPNNNGPPPEDEPPPPDDDEVPASVVESDLTLTTTSPQEWKQAGNDAFAQRNYEQAAAFYKKGLDAVCTATSTTSTSSAADAANDNRDTVDIDMRVNLLANRAMALLKLERYQAAQADCTCVLDEMGFRLNPKVYYRRALAREGQAKTMMLEVSSSKHRKALLQLALLDLEAARKLVVVSDNDKGMKQAITKATTRVQQAIQDQQEHESPPKKPPPTPQDRSTPLEQQPLPPPPLHVSPTVIPLPSPSQQRTDVIKLLQSSHHPNNNRALPGEAFFVVDWDWWCDWCQYVNLFTTEKKDDSKKSLLACLPAGAMLPDDDMEDDESHDHDHDDEQQYPPGPIDNSHLVMMPPPHYGTTTTTTQQWFYQQWYLHHDTTSAASALAGSDGNNNNNTVFDTTTTTALRPNLVRGYHYELVPREVYKALQSWYGEVTPSVCRRAVVVAMTGTTPSTTTDGNDDDNNNNKNNNRSHHPIVSVPLYPHPQDDDDNNNSNEENDETDNNSIKQQLPYHGSCCSACQAPHARLRCCNCHAASYCDRGCQESHWPFHKHQCATLAAAKKKKNTTTTNAATTNATTISSNDGRVGLNNLGNTCFMNSALQCLSHATPLTRHFLSNKFRQDLNPTNPLGTGGKLAKAYESVLKDVWMRNNNCRRGSSTSPSALKRAIALFAPRFAGCLQHDAQEFLAYLLDGLHEDLNRIRQAPYVEMPDVTDNQNMAVASARAWEAHLRRNDSLVLDTFYGQFKSTCVCPQCNRVSVSFDAFNHISLEIPQQRNNMMPFSVLLFRGGGGGGGANNHNDKKKLPVRYGIEMRRGSYGIHLRQGLSQLSGIPLNRLFICEVYRNVICEIIQDKTPLSDIHPNDFLVAYELEEALDSPSFHVIASHVLVVDPNNNAADTTTAANGFKPENFGIPFMTSFSSSLTCRQVWEHVWNLVARMVNEEDKDILQIRVHDEQGRAVEVFPSSSTTTADDFIDPAKQNDEESKEEQKSSILPSNSDIPIVDYLGQDATERFLFIRLEWNDESFQAAGEEDDGCGETKIEPKIDEERFIAFEVDQSWKDLLQKRRAMNGVKGVTLDQCFETFTTPERLDEHNKWYCSRCKEHVRAMKTMELWRLPNVLIVHLKRFEFKHALRRDKLDTFVDFPLEGFDMDRHCASPKEVPAVYDLFAVVNHYGRMGFGHYTAFARRWDETGIAGEWALFDDSSVRDVVSSQDGSVDPVVSSAAYVLFYRRRIFN